MKACVYTLGCKLNQYESFGIIDALQRAGYEVAEGLEPADLYVVNTCAVTAEAERKSRQVLAKIKKLNPEAKTVICGCASQKDPQAFLRKDPSLLVTGNFRKTAFLGMLDRCGAFLADPPAAYEDCFHPARVHTRPYLKVQDGCDNFCAYCIVPYLRGRSRSREIPSILAEANACGAAEIVLTGINLSDYGKNIGSSLPELMRALKGISARIRLGSLEVHAVTPELLAALADMPNFCPHFHLSLQSGSDRVLKDMNRHYTGEEFLRAVRLIREAFPEAGLTTDVIVGFPSEREEDFARTVEVCRAAAFSDLHIFPYSSREGTAAGKQKPLPKEVLRDRAARLEAVRADCRASFWKSQLGREQEVIFEERGEDGMLTGYSRNYLPCLIREAPCGLPVRVRAEEIRPEGAVVSLL